MQGKLLHFAYVLYQDILLFHQHHRTQFSGWTAHQRMTGYISTDHNPKYSESGGGAIQYALTYLCGLLFVLVF